MKKKLIIVTLDPTLLTWKTLPSKVKAIRKALDRTPNGQWDVTVVHEPTLTPEVVDGRITHTWFNAFAYPIFRQGYHHVYLHFSMRQWEAYGLDGGVRGVNHIDQDFVGECYGRGDEHTGRGRTRLNQFVQNVLHEMSHELARATGTPDRTHAYHGANPDISGIFTAYDMAKWQPIYQEGERVKLNLMNKLAELLKPKPVKTLVHPVQFIPRMVSQRYGVKSSRYRRTGRHIGTDYAIPVGTKLVAPHHGDVTTVGTHPLLGHFLHFQYEFQGEMYEERWCHLREKPKLGNFTRGHVVAFSGNTGDSTGPHLHREVWLRDVRVDMIDQNNWSVLTIDPETLPYNK